ncbi:uncharacterized protein LOC109724525 [Ananas comosus]|uniref:Uncharacterized protein LOC109724525 n=1 Tax=Ananas comosus TaxID=4615 RepID=A0A6P5GJW4_ANACO|nr:uncharacterized protein LOC109724525 [Ananas comosus]
MKEALQRWKAHLSPAGNGCEARWRWVTGSVAAALLFSCALLAYSAFLSAHYRWRCPDCVPSPAAPALRSASASAAAAATDLSHVVFGIGGSARTWDRRRGYTELWWRPGEMRGHVWLDEAPAGPWPATSPPYRVSADASRFGNRASAARIARIAAEAYRAASDPDSGWGGGEAARWFVMGDDDTVFFPENLVGVLGKYDHEEMYYIGAPSESVEQDVMHSYAVAFGGAGFAISYPAAAELARIIDACLQRYTNFYGSDERVSSCLSELGIPLTLEPGFHQVDVRGDAYGMLAAHPIAPLVSLHHLEYLKPVSPRGATQLEALRSLVGASRFDPARIVQQSICYERGPGYVWSVSVSWGYTVQLYPWTLYPTALEVALETFQTWRSFSPGPFTFNTRPVGPQDRPCQRPLIFFLDRVESYPDRARTWGGVNGTVTDYVMGEAGSNYHGCEGRGFGPASKIRKVTVFAPVMNPNSWKRAPRRQCCRTSRTKRGRVLEVRINNCSPGEVITPP